MMLICACLTYKGDSPLFHPPINICKCRLLRFTVIYLLITRNLFQVMERSAFMASTCSAWNGERCCSTHGCIKDGLPILRRTLLFMLKQLHRCPLADNVTNKLHHLLSVQLDAALNCTRYVVTRTMGIG